MTARTSAAKAILLAYMGMQCRFLSCSAFLMAPRPSFSSNNRGLASRSSFNKNHSPFFVNVYKSEQKRLHLATSQDSSQDTPAEESPPPLLGAMQAPTLVGATTAVIILSKIFASSSMTPRLFQLHVAGASLGSLVVLPAAIGSIQSRAGAVQAMKNVPASTRRATLLRHIQTHLYLTYSVSVLALVSISSILRHKERIGKAHFATLHSRTALTAGALWVLAYLVAQLRVWTPKLRMSKPAMRWKGPKLLWASKLHRSLGKAATLVTLCATLTGVRTWGRSALPAPVLAITLASIVYVQAALLWPTVVRVWRKQMIK